MRVHFFHRHVQDTVIILEEGNLPRPRCPQCDMLVPWHALNRRHLSSYQCANGAERNHIRLAEEYMRESFESIFQAYGEPLDTVTLFKYLGRVLTAKDNNWSAFSSNLRKSRKIWMQIMRILSREGAYPKVSGLCFKAVVQVVLIFWGIDVGPEPWMERGP